MEFKQKEIKQSLDEVDFDFLEIFVKLGIFLSEQKCFVNVVVDVVFDSVFIVIIYRKIFMVVGVIFCLIFEVICEYFEFVKKYFGKVVFVVDNYYVVLNFVVFSDGLFCYVFKDIVFFMEIFIYFRINVMEIGQFERMFIVCDDNVYVSYLEGCIVLVYDKNQFYVVVVEFYCVFGVEIKYFIVQNWYVGDINGNGGIYNFVIK